MTERGTIEREPRVVTRFTEMTNTIEALLDDHEPWTEKERISAGMLVELMAGDIVKSPDLEEVGPKIRRLITSDETRHRTKVTDRDIGVSAYRVMYKQAPTEQRKHLRKQLGLEKV